MADDESPKPDTSDQSDAAQRLINSVETAKQPSPAQTPAPRSTSPTEREYGELLTAIQAMPESIVSAIKEAFPTPQQPKKQVADQDTKVAKKAVEPKTEVKADDQEKQPGKKKSFSQMWFGN